MKLKQLGIRTGMEKAVVTITGAAADSAAKATEKAATTAACAQTYADGILTLEFVNGLEFCSGMRVELAAPQNMYSV